VEGQIDSNFRAATKHASRTASIGYFLQHQPSNRAIQLSSALRVWRGRCLETGNVADHHHRLHHQSRWRSTPPRPRRHCRSMRRVGCLHTSRRRPTSPPRFRARISTAPKTCFSSSDSCPSTTGLYGRTIQTRSRRKQQLPQLPKLPPKRPLRRQVMHVRAQRRLAYLP
jgi:hypothetical protein